MLFCDLFPRYIRVLSNENISLIFIQLKIYLWFLFNWKYISDLYTLERIAAIRFIKIQVSAFKVLLSSQ